MEVDSPGSSESTSGFPQLSRPAACQGYSSTDVENNTFHFVLICLILSVFVFKQTSDTNTFPDSDKYNSRIGQIQSVFSQRQGGGCEAVVQTTRHIPIKPPTPSTSPRPVLKMILQMRTFLIIMYRNGRYFSRCPAAVGGRSLFRPTPSSHCNCTAQLHISAHSAYCNTACSHCKCTQLYSRAYCNHCKQQKLILYTVHCSHCTVHKSTHFTLLHRAFCSLQVEQKVLLFYLLRSHYQK